MIQHFVIENNLYQNTILHVLIIYSLLFYFLHKINSMIEILNFIDEVNVVGNRKPRAYKQKPNYFELLSDTCTCTCTDFGYRKFVLIIY